MNPKQTANGVPQLIRWVLITAGIITLWRLGVAWVMPVTQDEAYYFDWSRSLAWGYFDHPPGVSLFARTSLLAPGSTLLARLGAVLASALAILVLALFYFRCGLRTRGDLLIAIVVAIGSIAGMVSGVLVTPDSVLSLAWILALHEALVALQGQRHRWLSAGLFVGLGLLGKYTMVLIGPVFLWAILWADPKALRTPWPYAGALIALIVFAPHIAWNAENSWITMRFQFGHGFAADMGSLLESRLPLPVDGGFSQASIDSSLRGLERLYSVMEYFVTQLVLLGLLAVVVAVSLFVRRGSQHQQVMWAPGAKQLLIAGTLVPLIFFAMAALMSAVEPNWPGVYLISAAPLISIWLRKLRVWVFIAAATNIGLLSLYAIHGATAALPLPDSLNRVLKETHGYPDLARWVARLEGPVFADRYQTTAMLRFYSPDSTITQWPGLTRPSEYLRGKVAATPTLQQLRAEGGFWLVARKGREAAFDGFVLTSRKSLYDCAGQPLSETSEPPCMRPLHRWEVYRFEAVSDP